MIASNRPHRDENPKLLVTSKQAAKALSISERTLYSYTKSGLISCVHMPSTGPKQETKGNRENRPLAYS